MSPDLMAKTYNMDGGPLTPNTPEEIPEGFFYSSDARSLNTRLLDAIEVHDNSEVLRLLNNGASPNATCHGCRASACHMAVLHNNIEAIDLLLQRGAARSRRDGLGRTLLHLAAWRGSALHLFLLLDLPKDLLNQISLEWSTVSIAEAKRHKMLQLMIDLPCNIDNSPVLPEPWQDNVQHKCMNYNAKAPSFPACWSPLHVTSARARPYCVRLLLAAGADVFARDSFGRTPLDVAGAAYYMGKKIVVRKFREVINMFMDAGVTFNDLPGQISPLHTAIELQDLEAIDLLKMIAAGASTSALNHQGYSAMHICVIHQLKDHLQLLADCGGINSKDRKGHTVLHSAVKAEWLEGVCIALQAGADIFERAETGESALYTAVVLGNAEILKNLLSNVHSKAIANHVTNNETVLYTAIHRNHIECVKVLLEHVVTITQLTSNNNNVLHVAAYHGRFEMLQVLLDYADEESLEIINFENDDGYTPIYYAVRHNYPDCVKALLSKNASVHFKLDKEASTILHLAAAANYVEIAKLIIEHDCATVHALDWEAKQPLHQAAYHSSRDVIALLLQNGADLSTPAGNKTKTTAIDLIMNNLSKPTEFMEATFDEYITSRDDLDRSGQTVMVGYDILVPNMNDMRQMRVIKALLNTGNRHKQRSLLLHPILESFLYLKWKALVPFFYIILVLYGCFVISLNAYVVSVFMYIDKYVPKNKELPVFFGAGIWKYFMIMTTAIIALQEVMHMKLRSKSYFLRLETWVKWMAIGPSMFLPWVVTCEVPYIPEWARLLATVTILMSWVEMMFLLSRFPTWGFYIFMFGKVTSKIVKIFLTFMFLIIGFSFSFLIQFRSKPPFENPIAAIVKTIVMLSAEFDYNVSFTKETAKELTASLITLRIMFVVFLVLASIVLLNLMIGLAVDDVNQLQKVGKIRRLEKQVEFLTSLEKNVYIDFMQRLPRIFSSYLKIKKLLNNAILLREDNFHNIDLPSHLKDAFFEKAHSKRLLMKEQDNNETTRVKIDQLYDAMVKNSQSEQVKRDTVDINNVTNDLNGDVLDNMNASLEKISLEMAALKKTFTRIRMLTPQTGQ